MTKIAIFIDGCNFLYGLRSVDHRYTDFKFDFEKFCKEFITLDRDLVKVFYYNASVKSQFNPNLYKNQQKFFSRLSKVPNFNIVLCKRQAFVKDDGSVTFSVKGDDIHLAIDMLKFAYEELYDTAVLISGDGDFAPAVKYVKERGKKVENVHFSGRVSYNLISKCNSSKTISKKIIKKFFYSKNSSKQPKASK